MGKEESLTCVEGALVLHGGSAGGDDAPAEDEEAQPCGRPHLCDGQIAGHLKDEVPKGEDACSSSARPFTCQHTCTSVLRGSGGRASVKCAC